MSAGEGDAEAVMDLIIERAKRIVQNPEFSSNPAASWRERVGKSWRNVYQHMSRPSPEFGVWKTTAARRETALRFANLGFEALMAAWYIGIQAEDGEDQPGMVARHFCEMWEKNPPRSR